MINKLNIFLIFFFLGITFVKSIIAEEFFFDSPEILVLENGNLLNSNIKRHYFFIHFILILIIFWGH